MPKPTISNQIIPEPTQALARASPTGDKPLPEFGQEVPFPAIPHPAKGPPLYWKTNVCLHLCGQADPQVYGQKAIDYLNS